jgi:hypothetical protein
MRLQRFERGLERLVEGTFAKVFRSGLQPVELGRRLAREMDLRRTVGVNGVVAPNHFEISLNQGDWDRFSSFIDALNRELVESVREHARKERYTFLGTVAVELRVETNLSSGMFLVNGSFQEQPGGGPVGVLITVDGRNITLGDNPVSIGRLPECDIAVTDPNVSRKHAEIRRHGNDYVVVDLGSTNGTRVNGTWVNGERRLHDGDEISVGSSVIRFEGS